MGIADGRLVGTPLGLGVGDVEGTGVGDADGRPVLDSLNKSRSIVPRADIN